MHPCPTAVILSVGFALPYKVADYSGLVRLSDDDRMAFGLMSLSAVSDFYHFRQGGQQLI